MELSDLKQGSEDAWREAFQILWPIALRAAGGIPFSLESEETEDAANEALAELVRRVDTVRSVDELRALAATIAYRRAISTARRKTAEKRIPPASTLPGGESSMQELPDEPAAMTGCLDDVELAELALLLRPALAELDGETRQLLVEKICEGWTYRELAERHHRPEPTVTARIRRGLATLRSHLAARTKLTQEIRDLLRY